MVESNSKKRLGYCPTMKRFVTSLNKLNDLEIIEVSNAAQVLNLLKLNKIDIGIIGRIAKKSEFDGFFKRIRSGYTLIANYKGIIENSKLFSLEIHTNVSKSKVEKLFPELKNVKYHNNLDDALKKGEVQLISWDDWNDNFELLIPVDNYGNKNDKFRVPHIYSYNKDDLLNLVVDN